MGKSKEEMLRDLQLDVLKKEVAKRKKEKERLEEIRKMQNEILYRKVKNAPARFSAEHPVWAFLARQGYQGAKTAANDAYKIANKATEVASKGINASVKKAGEVGNGIINGIERYQKWRLELESNPAYQQAQARRMQERLMERQLENERIARERQREAEYERKAEERRREEQEREDAIEAKIREENKRRMEEERLRQIESDRLYIQKRDEDRKGKRVKV